jgi:hypothetical protein
MEIEKQFSTFGMGGFGGGASAGSWRSSCNTGGGGG